MYQRDGDTVTLTMTGDQYLQLMMLLGAALVAAVRDHNEFFMQESFVRLVDDLNEGHPDYRRYTLNEETMETVPIVDDKSPASLLAAARFVTRPCPACEQSGAFDFCVTCDEFYWIHANGCWKGSRRHDGHRLTIVPFVEE